MRKPMRYTIRILCATAISGVLVACGGGSDTALQASTTYNLQAGYADLLRMGETVTVSLSGSVVVNGVSAAFTGNGTLVFSPSAAGTFNGTSAVSQMESISGTVTAGGQSAAYNSSVTAYYDSTPAFLGESSNGEFDVAAAPIAFPTSVMGGSSGMLGTVSRYSDSALSLPLGTAQLSYAVTAPVSAGGAATVALTTKIYDTQNALLETDVTIYALTTGSVMTFSKATVQSADGNLTVTAP